MEPSTQATLAILIVVLTVAATLELFGTRQFMAYLRRS
jgi:uncharacterized membrane protein SpoIIM required for sporulation